MRKAVLVFVFLSAHSFATALPNPVGVSGQATTRVPTIGLLPAASLDDRLEEFTQRLRVLGYIEGQTIELVPSQPALSGRANQREALDERVDQLVKLPVDLLIAGNRVEALAAKKATRTIPVVFWARDSEGIVENREQPGENITGITIESESPAQHLQLLKEIIPDLIRLGVLLDSTERVPTMVHRSRKLELATRSLGIKLRVFDIRDRDKLGTAFSTMIEEGVEAVYVLSRPRFGGEATRIAELAAKGGMPVMSPLRESAEAGSLIGFEPDFRQVSRHTADYVAKILQGAKAGDLPVEESMEFRMSINLETARKLGLTIPESVLQEMDEVIR